jgi:hypothetical protein
MASFSHEILRLDGTPPKHSPVEQPNEPFNELDKLSLKEILDEDCRPTFIVDLEHNRTTGHCIQPILVNASLKRRTQLLSEVAGETDHSASAEAPSSTAAYNSFRNWATAVGEHVSTEDAARSFRFDGFIWTKSTVRQRWRIISGNTLCQTTEVLAGDLRSAALPKTETGRNTLHGITQAETKSAEATGTHKPESVSTNTRKKSGTTTAEKTLSMPLSKPEGAVPDWTVSHPSGVLTEYMLFARTIDWASTPLGPMKDWSMQFRELANLIMVSKWYVIDAYGINTYPHLIQRIPYPAALFWGEELTTLYNEAYGTEIAGKKHPQLMGTGAFVPFSESWADVGPVFQECVRTGHSQKKNNGPVPIHRHGYLEETFLSWSLVPIYGGTDRIRESSSSFKYYASKSVTPTPLR